MDAPMIVTRKDVVLGTHKISDGAGVTTGVT